MPTSITIKPRHGLILLMLADGAGTKEIAEELSISHWTVKHDIQLMRRIFNAKNNCNLIALAYQRGILNGRQFADG